MNESFLCKSMIEKGSPRKGEKRSMNCRSSMQSQRKDDDTSLRRVGKRVGQKSVQNRANTNT